jgi:MoxR-like ATPase
MTHVLPPELAPFATGSALDRQPQVEQAAARVREGLSEMQRVVSGQERLLERLLLGLLADGHLLLEGLPGLAKTLAVRTLAVVVGGHHRRVQFTPDLLPSDLIGTMIYDQRAAQFTVQKGPIFTDVLLADEINRAPAKVQSALLEAMQERQVTIGGESHRLPPLFLVLATQNPIEHEGTYPLPEAQLDRFLFKLLITYPARADERAMLDRMTDSAPPEPRAVLTPAELLEARALAQTGWVDGAVKEYVLDLVTATREPAAAGLPELAPLIEYGASPRASLALVRAAKARAFLQGRAWVVPDDVRDVAHDVLRHRIVATYRADAEGLTADAMVDRIVTRIAAP